MRNIFENGFSTFIFWRRIFPYLSLPEPESVESTDGLLSIAVEGTVSQIFQTGLVSFSVKSQKRYSKK